MSTRANWPEKMRLGETHTAPKYTSVFLIDDNGYLGDVIGCGIEESQSRARQVCALPKMVEFHKKIKAMSEKECDHTWFPDEILEENEAILREIGEVE